MTTHNTSTPTTAADAVTTEEDRIAEIYLGPHGDAVQPIVPRHATVRHVRALDLRPGMRVLEIGTGSGYSAALMSRIVGTRGHVLTIDSDVALAERAGALFSEHGHPALAAVGNGLAGHPGRAPYDRIFAGATPAAIPSAWIDQLAPGGMLVTGCLVSDLPGSYAVAYISKTPQGLRATIRGGRYPLMGPAATPNTIAIATAKDNPDYFVATIGGDRARAALLLDALRGGKVEPWPDRQGEFLDLRNWLLAMRPTGLLTTVTELGEGIGVGAVYGGRPEVGMVTPAHFVANPAPSLRKPSPTAARLLDLVAEWRREGTTATHDLEPRLFQDGDAYYVRADI